MAFRKKGKGNDKYLRLTGLWQSKKNDALWTGKLKDEQMEALEAKLKEAFDNGAPLMFSLWENDKKESKRDPEFSLQCFVGDNEEQPRSNRGSSRRDRDRDEEEEEEAPRRKRKPALDEEEEPEEEGEELEEEEEEEPAPRKKGTSTRKSREAAPKKKKRADW